MAGFFVDSVSADVRNNDVDTTIFMREARRLQEIIVNPKKEKYSAKNNPAVELVRRIRKDQKNGDPRKMDKYSYDQYDKTTLGLLDITEEDIIKHEFLVDYMDVTSIGNRPVLNIQLNEKASTILYSGGKDHYKTVIRGKTSNGISEMFDVGDTDVMLDELMREVDIYSDDITLLSNKFPGPLSSSGNSHYRYFITDTLDVDGIRCIQLTFSPKYPAEFSFSGSIYVPVDDDTGFIRKVSMKVPRTVNLNFIDNLYIEQTFEKDSSGKRHKVSDSLSADICLVKGTQRLYASRSSKYENFSYKKRSDLSKAYEMLGTVIDIQSLSESSDSFLADIRGESLSESEGNMGSLMSDLRKIPFFYWSEKVLMILVNGYIKTGRISKFDFGPINTFISANPVEKVRLRVGGITTANLSPHWFAGGYVAYGVHDKKCKYKAELEYSFNKKKYHSREFPVNGIKAMHMYDMDMVGQHYLYTNPDNVFISLKRRKDMLITYRHLSRIEYNLELNNHLSFSVYGEHRKQDASPWLPFVDGNGKMFSHYRRTSFGLSVRFSPGERMLQTINSRIPVNREAPVIAISQEWGPRSLPGADFSICKTELFLQKRFWFSSYGALDAIVKGGILWTQVPYVELLWPNANLSYTIQPESYSLMNPMEFAMDRFASCDLTYWGNGVLFNRIPLLKLARLREVIGFKCLWGSLTYKNDPEYHSGLFRFPADAEVGLLHRTPYMEISAGIDNIFRILRVDYVWRLSYLDTPGIDRSGLRVALHFTF
ncbi:MAG: carboxypeptidase-like regulatory domain-containing protein [Muribaculaceae bacterium]|nr:carboxypeptidase-like regulatory domain-containing protein [Muribaculaceae bacterium]